MASHSTQQYLPEPAGHEQTGCAHLGPRAGFIAIPGFTVAILFLLAPDGGRGNCPIPPFQSDFQFLLIAAFDQEVARLGVRCLWFADQLLKQGPKMNHGLSQIFGAGLATRLAHRALMSRPVIVEDQRMVYGMNRARSSGARGWIFKLSTRSARFSSDDSA